VVWWGTVRWGKVRFGEVWRYHRRDGFGVVWFLWCGSVGLGEVRFGKVQPSKRWVRWGKVWYGEVRSGAVSYGNAYNPKHQRITIAYLYHRHSDG